MADKDKSQQAELIERFDSFEQETKTDLKALKGQFAHLWRLVDERLKHLSRRVGGNTMAINANTKSDDALREVVRRLEKSEGAIASQDRKAEAIKAEQKQHTARFNRNNLLLFGFVAILGFFYVKGEIQAGQIIEVTLALSAAGAIGVVATKNGNGKKNGR